MVQSETVQLVSIVMTAIVAIVVSITGLMTAQVKANSIETKLTSMQTNITALETKTEVDKVHVIVNNNETAMKTKMAEMASQYEKLLIQSTTMMEQLSVSQQSLARAEGMAEGKAGAPTPYPSVAGGNGGQHPEPATIVNTQPTIMTVEKMDVEAETVAVDQKNKGETST